MNGRLKLGWRSFFAILAKLYPPIMRALLHGSDLKSSNLSIHNIKLIEHSNILVLIGVITFLINISLSSFYLSALIFGVLIGIFLGLCLPWLWKKEFSLANSLVTIIAVVTASFYLNKTIDLYASIQMLSIVIFTPGLIWYVQKSKLIKYLMA